MQELVQLVESVAGAVINTLALIVLIWKALEYKRLFSRGGRPRRARTPSESLADQSKPAGRPTRTAEDEVASRRAKERLRR